MMKVLIDGIPYIPEGVKPPVPFALTYDHWDLAAQHPNPFQAIKWAWESEALPAELAAWIRAVTGEIPERNPPVKPDKKRPLEIPKPKPALF